MFSKVHLLGVLTSARKTETALSCSLELHESSFRASGIEFKVESLGLRVGFRLRVYGFRVLHGFPPSTAHASSRGFCL